MTSSLSWTSTASHRPEGSQEPKAISTRTLKGSSSLSKSIWTGRREATGLRCSQEQHESCEAEWCIQEHTPQREVVATEERQKLVQKSLEIHVEEKQVAEIKNKVQTVKNSLEVANRSIKLTPHGSRTFVAECEPRWTMYQLPQRWRVSKPGPRREEEVEWIETEHRDLVRNPKLTGQTGEERNTESRTRRTRRRSKLFLISEEYCSSEKDPREGKVQGQVSTRTSLFWNTSWGIARSRITWTGKLESGTHISSRRRSSRTTPARLHSTRETHNTNLEEHHTPYLRTKMFGGIENAVVRKETWTSNPGWYTWWRMRACEQRFQTSRSVSILSSNIWQNVHDNASLRPRPRHVTSRQHQPQKGWRFALVPLWASRHIGGFWSIPTVDRCPQGKAVGSPTAPHLDNKTQTLTWYRGTFVKHLQPLSSEYSIKEYWPRTKRYAGSAFVNYDLSVFISKFHAKQKTYRRP